MAVGLEGMLVRRRRAALAAVVLGCLLLLAVPAAASAAAFLVNSAADEADLEPGNGTCESAGGVCTLRAAVEEANESATVDQIEFDSSFHGQAGHPITLTLGDIAIKAPVQVLGSLPGQLCSTSATAGSPPAPIPGPCVEVAGGGLDVESANVLVRGLAITGAATAVSVVGESAGFVARNDWIGVGLDGAAGANGTGIFVGQGSNGAIIGGRGTLNPAEPEPNPDRNVIAGNEGVGLDLLGASDAAIQGNYFGVEPSGTEALANAKDIEISDSTEGQGFQAEGDEIGGVLSSIAPVTPECDDACNLIDGATEAGVELEGDGAGQNEAPASGPTVIQGNYVGLGAGGVGSVRNVEYGVLTGGAGRVSVGGPLISQANHILGGEYGVYGTGGGELRVVGNQIGFDGLSKPRLPPSKVAIFIDSQNLPSALAAEVEFNRIQMSTGEGIEQLSAGAEIAANMVRGATIAIHTVGAVGAAGNSIQGNLIENSFRGVLVENDDNTIAGNEIFRSDGAAIGVQSSGSTPATGNVIGGDSPSSENRLFEGLSAPIEIVDESPAGNSENEVARNRGAGNGGPFIDLGANGPGNPGPNGGIQPPALSSATEAGVAGSALPGALVRVFRKAAPEAGEIESFLGEAVADSTGGWTVAYPSSIPAGTIVAATQTNPLGGTSELATAVTPPPPVPTPPTLPPPACTGVGCSPPPGPVAPKTKITKGPPKRSSKHSVSFRFRSSLRGSTFQCRLDRSPFRRCRSPKRYRHLKPGRHVFRVRAVSRLGVVDPTPAVRRFRVLPRRGHA